MRRVIAGIQMSVDGFIEGPRGELDWAIAEDEETWSVQVGQGQADLPRVKVRVYGNRVPGKPDALMEGDSRLP